MRFAWLFAASCALGFAAPSSARATESGGPARVEASDIRVGDTLQAVRDVSLDAAVIAEGSKVSVSARKSAQGRVLLDVVLADGHVVRSVPLVEIRNNFRRLAR